MHNLLAMLVLTAVMLNTGCDSDKRNQTEFIASVSGGMFSSLTIGQRLEANYGTSGCFHHARYELVFVCDDSVASVDVTSIETRWSQEEGREIEIGRELLGTLELSRNDLLRLDRLVPYYEQLPGDISCTTVHGVDFRLMKAGRVIDESSYQDGTCGIFERNDVLSMGELVGRLL